MVLVKISNEPIALDLMITFDRMVYISVGIVASNFRMKISYFKNRGIKKFPQIIKFVKAICEASYILFKMFYIYT